MRPKSLILLALALGCGLVASIGISQVMDRRGSKPAVLETEAIYVAKVDINLGEMLTAETVRLDEWPKSKLPMGAVTTLEDLLERRPRTKIYEGEPIVEVKLRAKNAIDDPSQQIPKGYRVVPVAVKKDTGGSGLIGPGDRVDVQLFAKKKGAISRTVVKTVLTNIRVFAVNTQIRRGTGEDDKMPKASVVSLLVTPDQANILTLAIEIGAIKMIIRNPDDNSKVMDRAVTVSDLFKGDAGDREKERRAVKPVKPKASPNWMDLLAQAAGRAQPPPWSVEVLQGASRTEVLFDDNGKPLNSPRKLAPVDKTSAVTLPVSDQAEDDKDDTAAQSGKSDRELDQRDDETITEDDLILPDDPREDY
jgi:pilus assembly protein CpaB